MLTVSAVLMTFWFMLLYVRTVLRPSSGCGTTKSLVFWLQVLYLLPRLIPPPAAAQSSTQVRRELGEVACVCLAHQACNPSNPVCICVLYSRCRGSA